MRTQKQRRPQSREDPEEQRGPHRSREGPTGAERIPGSRGPQSRESPTEAERIPGSREDPGAGGLLAHRREAAQASRESPLQQPHPLYKPEREGRRLQGSAGSNHTHNHTASECSKHGGKFPTGAPRSSGGEKQHPLLSASEKRPMAGERSASRGNRGGNTLRGHKNFWAKKQ